MVVDLAGALGKKKLQIRPFKKGQPLKKIHGHSLV
jgi:hypothetical protein